MICNIVKAGMCVVAFGWAPIASAGTILKLTLGGDAAADIEFDGALLSTIDDGAATTDGDQNTAVDFTEFLSGNADILSPDASFTLSGLAPSGAATVFGNVVVIQKFTGGSLSLYDPSNNLLLAGTLAESTLTGTIGPPATGALFSSTFGSITGGSLAPQVLPGSLTLSMSLNDVNGGAGFSVAGATAPILDPFTSDATLSIGADPIPEPASLLLALAAGILGIAACQRSQRGPH